MKKLKIMLASLLGIAMTGAVTTATAAEKGGALPLESSAAKGGEQTFTPVLGADFIRFGNKTLKLLPEGGIQCITPEHGILFTTGMPLFTVDKNGRHLDWNLGHLDREKSKFRREGNKYIWELWYKDEKVAPFQGISQSLEVLPDGRLLYISQYHIPAETPELKLKTWTFGFQLKDSIWLNEKVILDGKNAVLDQDFPRYRTAWNQKKADLVFGADSPAKKFAFHVDLEKNFISYLAVYRPAKQKHVEVRFGVVNRNDAYNVYFDFRPVQAARGNK